jgi:dTDP-4-amino-4,6-dideoxygalactose transaminase
MGLCNLKYLDDIVAGRRSVSERYTEQLTGYVQLPVMPTDTNYNYSYYPVLLKDEATVRRVTDALAQEDIFPRRYFYPSLNTLPYIENQTPCPVSEDISSRILCLPLYPDLEPSVVDKVCEVIKA